MLAADWRRLGCIVELDILSHLLGGMRVAYRPIFYAFWAVLTLQSCTIATEISNFAYYTHFATLTYKGGKSCNLPAFCKVAI